MGSVTQGTRFLYLAEATWGTTPTTGEFSNKRLTGETLTPNLTVTESDALRDDGQITNQIEVDASGSGEVTGELMYNEWNGWLRAGLLDGSYSSTATEIDCTVNAVTWARSSGSGSSKTAVSMTVAGTTWGDENFEVGMWVVSAGQSNSNNLIGKIQSISGTAAYLSPWYGLSSVSAITESASSTGTITQLSEACNSTTIPSYSIEISDRDDNGGTTNEFRAYKGMTVTSVRLDFPSAEKATVTFGLDGKKPTQPTSTIVTGSATVGSQGTTDPMVSGDIFLFRMGDPDLTTAAGSQTLEWDDDVFSVLSGSIEYSPSLRPRRQWGTTGPAVAPGRGTMRASGNFQIYYNQSATTGRDDQALVNVALSDSVTGFVLGIKDDAGNFLIFECPRCKISSISTNSAGKDQDVIADLSLAAYRHPDDTNPDTSITGVTMRIVQGTSLPTP